MLANLLISPEGEMIEFARQLVRIKSYPGQEGQAIQACEDKMNALGFDEVHRDSMGNVFGKMGRGTKSIWFESHVDTVEVNDAAAWEHPPFGGVIANDRLHGRGSVDMKSSVAASIYAAAWAKQNGWLEGKTVYVSCTVLEEDCDGENLKLLFQETGLRPDAVVICEPSNGRIAVGHKGKAQVLITTHGISAHGATPEKGKNAIYEMAEVIQRAERLNAKLAASAQQPKPTLVLSQVKSLSASLNAVPTECSVYLDRRMIVGETRAHIEQEIRELIAGKNATWQLGTLIRQCYTGKEVHYEPFHLAWKIDLQHSLAKAAQSAYVECFRQAPDCFEFWDFSTNAVT
ncbi:MAG: YgeY family selenium metabolism-linked hydrolase, partial [Flammeovirgaceae bacterium]